MNDIRKDLEKFSFDLWRTIKNVAIFMILSAISWIVFNEGRIAEPDGFDPLRYEYYARYGLPHAFTDSSSYRLVLFLEYLYKFAPHYWGYILFISIILFGMRFFDRLRMMSLAVFSPIAFYYLGQTGKDGIAILAIIGAAMIASTPRNAGAVLFVALITVLAFYVRPAIVLIVPVAIVQVRYGTMWALMSCLPVGILFLASADLYDVVSTLGGLTGDEGAGGVAALLRTYTFGYEFTPIIVKFGLLAASLFFQPLLGFLKFYNGSPIFVIYESICFAIFFMILIKQKLVFKFLICSLPYVVTIGISSPFYHFRYMAIIYPMIWAYARFSSGWGWRRSSSILAQVSARRILKGK